jgi:hypothetical protein
MLVMFRQHFWQAEALFIHKQEKIEQGIWKTLNDVTATEIEIQVTLRLHPPPLQQALGPEGVITQERLMEHDR